MMQMREGWTLARTCQLPHPILDPPLGLREGGVDRRRLVAISPRLRRRLLPTTNLQLVGPVGQLPRPAVCRMA